MEKVTRSSNLEKMYIHNMTAIVVTIVVKLSGVMPFYFEIEPGKIQICICGVVNSRDLRILAGPLKINVDTENVKIYGRESNMGKHFNIILYTTKKQVHSLQHWCLGAISDSPKCLPTVFQRHINGYKRKALTLDFWATEKFFLLDDNYKQGLNTVKLCRCGRRRYDFRRRYHIVQDKKQLVDTIRDSRTLWLDDERIEFLDVE